MTLDEKVYTRFDVKLIDLVQPLDGHDLVRKLDMILYFLQLGDDPKYTCRDRWCATDLGAHMSGSGRGENAGEPITIAKTEDIDMAMRMAILGHGHGFVDVWRKDHRIHVDETHRVYAPHLRHHQWNRWEAGTGPWGPVLNRFLTGGHPIAVSLNCYHLEVRDLGRLELVARPVDGSRPRKHTWSLTSREITRPIARQDPGEPIAHMLTRAFDYIEGLKKPGAAFVKPARGNPFEYGVFREGGDPQAVAVDLKHHRQVAGPFPSVNDAVREAIRLNAAGHGEVA